MKEKDIKKGALVKGIYTKAKRVILKIEGENVIIQSPTKGKAYSIEKQALIDYWELVD
jgi:hypothetical protein